MTPSRSKRFWKLVHRQHGVVAHEQLRGLGFTRDAIKHRVAVGRLHRLHVGVYAVGRPEVSEHGRWSAAVLACGPGSLLGDEEGAALFGFGERRGSVIHVVAPTDRRRPGIRVRVRAAQGVERDRIPVTTIVDTLIDIALNAKPRRLDRAVGQIDYLGLMTVEALRVAVEAGPPRPGTAIVRKLLDQHTFVMTHTELESRFVAIVRAAGLPLPGGQRRVGANRVDFLWPELGLVVETDGLRAHRTPSQQAKDLERDQRHALRGLERLRFTHHQVRHQSEHVERVLRGVIARLSAAHPISRAS